MAIVTKENVSRKVRDQFDRGFSAMDRGNLDYAIEMFHNSLKLEPGFFEARRFLRAASVKRFKNANKGAIAHLVSSITGGPKVMAARAMMGKKPLKSLEMAEELLQVDPLNPMFVYLLADVAARLNMPEVSVQGLEIIRDHRPNDFKLLHRLAAAYKNNSQMPEARASYERLLAMKPNNQALIKEYKDATALATMQEGGWGKATSYRDVIKDTKEAANIEHELKVVKSDQDFNALITETLAKIEQEPDNINYRRALGDLYSKSGRLEDALRALNEAQAVTGGGDPQIDRATSAVQISIFERDIEALESDGNAEAAAAKRAELDDFILADALDRVTRYPNDREFKYEYGVLLFDRDRYNDAIEQFQAAQQNPKHRVNALFYLARCFKAKEQYDIAREQLDQAIGDLPAMTSLKKDILYEMGDLAERMNDPKAATDFYKEIYSVDISYKDVSKKIEQSYDED